MKNKQFTFSGFGGMELPARNLIIRWIGETK